MALFSQRFWMQLATLDAKVVVSQRTHQESRARLLVGRRLFTGSALVECWVDLIQTTRTAGSALDDINHFCNGRSKGAAFAADDSRSPEALRESRPEIHSTL